MGSSLVARRRTNGERVHSQLHFDDGRTYALTGLASDKYSAGEQGLGYIYQPRFALLRLLELPESTEVLIEKDDDIDFIDANGPKALASLKHKAEGDRLTDLSTDFWKSVRIWLSRYDRDGRQDAKLTFFIFTTAAVSSTSFLLKFVNRPQRTAKDHSDNANSAAEALSKSTTKLATEVREQLALLDQTQREDFFSRVTIVDSTVRISDIPQRIMDLHMRSIQRDFRQPIFERLEGWWNNVAVDLLTGARTEAISGFEVSDKLAALADEYKFDNLPIHFAGTMPVDEIDTDGDDRQFVVQLREIGVKSERIRSAILDYYRAFAQRSAWARENVLISGEIENYEDRLVDEWRRFRDVLVEELDDESANAAMTKAGRALYQWAEMETASIAALRIRERVTEPFIVRGGFHILANTKPVPRVYWHPRFLDRVTGILAEAV
jgi:hypothetical protein